MDLGEGRLRVAVIFGCGLEGGRGRGHTESLPQAVAIYIPQRSRGSEPKEAAKEGGWQARGTSDAAVYSRIPVERGKPK